MPSLRPEELGNDGRWRPLLFPVTTTLVVSSGCWLPNTLEVLFLLRRPVWHPFSVEVQPGTLPRHPPTLSPYLATALMERSQATRRSASHGPLSQSSLVDTDGLSRAPKPRWPLQSVDGNAFLLTSPAPLASLLRKTTETGDIGLFSIGSARSLNTFHGPMRSGSAQPKPTNATPAPIKRLEEPDLVDDRKTLPSYRDGFVEMTLLYRSANTTPGSRSFSSPSHSGYPPSAWSCSIGACSSGLTRVERSGGTPDSGSSDIRNPILVDWQSRSRDWKKYPSPECGRRTLSLSSTVGLDERSRDEPSLKGSGQVSLPSTRCLSYSKDSDDTFSDLPVTPGYPSRIQDLDSRFCQADVSD